MQPLNFINIFFSGLYSLPTLCCFQCNAAQHIYTTLNSKLYEVVNEGHLFLYDTLLYVIKSVFTFQNQLELPVDSTNDDPLRTSHLKEIDTITTFSLAHFIILLPHIPIFLIKYVD